MKKTLNNLFVLAFVCIAAGCASKYDSKEEAKEQNESKLKDTGIESDAKFAVEVADGGMLEVKLGQLAQANGSSSAVKDLGRMMETDHTKANDELKAWAANKNVTLPGILSEKSQKKYDDLAAKKGNDFDKAYASCMVDDHKEDIDKFQKEADNGKDEDLKTWASGKLPVLQHHLEMSKSTNEHH